LDTTLAFVTASPENLRSFANDVVLDEIQVREAGIALDFDRKDPEVARRLEEALERLRKRKAELGLTRHRPMFTSEMARVKAK
jgi:D-ribose pyranose/furanose isomerase RbsD